MFIAVAMLALKGETRTLWFSGDDSGKKGTKFCEHIKSKTQMTGSILKQDPNT